METNIFGRKLSEMSDYFTSKAEFNASFTRSKRGVITALWPLFAKLVFNKDFNKDWVVYPNGSIIYTQLPKAVGWLTDSSRSREKRGVIMTVVLIGACLVSIISSEIQMADFRGEQADVERNAEALNKKVNADRRANVNMICKVGMVAEENRFFYTVSQTVSLAERSWIHMAEFTNSVLNNRLDIT